MARQPYSNLATVVVWRHGALDQFCGIGGRRHVGGNATIAAN